MEEVVHSKIEGILNKQRAESKEKKSCLELTVGLYQNLKKGQDQYTRRMKVKLNHL
jgi:hypothetical protein